MMSRVVVFLFAFLSLFAGSQIYAAPTHEIVGRQIGNLVCNFDRLSIVAGIATLKGTLKTLSGQTVNDTAASTGIQSVTDSVSGAESAIGVIAKALITGQAAPADARTQVQGNLTAAQTALAGINSTDATISSNLDKATTELANAALAGQGVVANCK